MAGKRQKRAKRTKKIRLKAVHLLLPVILGGIALLGSSFYIFRSSAKSPFVYEEVYSRPSELKKEISKVDRAVYESLYRKGVREKDILFLSVRPEIESGDDWDFTELLIRMTDRASASQLDGLISRALGELKPSILYSREERRGREIIGRVYTLGRCTHRVVLSYSGQDRVRRKGRPKIAFIMDDLGYDLAFFKELEDLDLSIVCSVLPLAPHTERISDAVRRRGWELMLHLPMEPKEYPRLNPGPGALRTDMEAREILCLLGDHLRQIPEVQGVNNHMGSRFSEDEEKMALVLNELKTRGLFYIDSRTTSRTVAVKVARRLGVPAASRSVFLDNDLSEEAMNFQMKRLLGIARHKGSAIGIGHPHRETLKVLRGYLGKLKEEVEIVKASDLVS